MKGVSFILFCLSCNYFLHKSIAENRNLTNKIANGIPAKPGEFPYMVRIGTKGTSCNGILVHMRWVITLADCYNAKPKTVTLNTDNGISGPEIEVEYFVSNRGWGKPKNPEGIVAVLKLKTPIITPGNAPGVHPVKLASSNKQFKVGTKVLMVGWGETESSKGKGSSKLLKVETTVRPDRDCDKDFPGLPPVFMCTGGPGSSMCAGDRGGAMILKGANSKEDILVGMLFYPKKGACSKNLAPNVAIKISTWNFWLRYLAKEHGDIIP